MASSCCIGRSSKSSLGSAMTVTRLVRTQRSHIIMLCKRILCTDRVRNMSLPSEIIEERPLQPDYAIPLIQEKEGGDILKIWEFFKYKIKQQMIQLFIANKEDKKIIIQDILRKIENTHIY